jgi:hypothetical protein
VAQPLLTKLALSVVLLVHPCVGLCSPVFLQYVGEDDLTSVNPLITPEESNNPLRSTEPTQLHLSLLQQCVQAAWLLLCA